MDHHFCLFFTKIREFTHAQEIRSDVPLKYFGLQYYFRPFYLICSTITILILLYTLLVLHTHIHTSM